MSKATEKNRKGGGVWLAVTALALVALIAVTLMRRDRAAEPPVAEYPGAAGVDAAELDSGSPFHRLRGRWMRTDGDYLLDLRWVGSDGQVEAAYLNPRPVHVSRAEALEDDRRVKLLVELQDVGYPGCVYTLHYDADRDRMSGTYYQAAIRETFVVEFSRYREGE
jgi:hypothetical protein